MSPTSLLELSKYVERPVTQRPRLSVTQRPIVTDLWLYFELMNSNDCFKAHIHSTEILHKRTDLGL